MLISVLKDKEIESTNVFNSRFFGKVDWKSEQDNTLKHWAHHFLLKHIFWALH